jgi:hypothetical protein
VSARVISRPIVRSSRLAIRRGDVRDAVSLHAHAEAMLARNAQALYPTDQAVSDGLLGAARDRLGESTYADIRREGEATNIGSLLQRAERILASVGQPSPATD